MNGAGCQVSSISNVKLLGNDGIMKESHVLRRVKQMVGSFLWFPFVFVLHQVASLSGLIQVEYIMCFYLAIVIFRMHALELTSFQPFQASTLSGGVITMTMLNRLMRLT